MHLDLAALQHAWSIPGPWTLHHLTRGTNNQTLRVETPAGDYILRVSGNHADPTRLRFEHTVLTHLRRTQLAFAVPVPLPTAVGEFFVRLETVNGEGLATLTAYIPGRHPDAGDLTQARAGGEALGMLDAALAELVTLDAGDGVSWRSSGDLAHGHALVADPPAAFSELPIEKETRQRLVDAYERMMEHIPDVYATLPQQIIHEDFDMSNIVFDKGHVTGVLDFEFCGRDVRVMDLTVALNWWPFDYFGSGGEWPIIHAVAGGYAQFITLTEKELAALPVLILYRAFTSLVHRLGRYRQGLSSLESVMLRANAAVERDAWVHANGGRLVEEVRRAGEGNIPS